MLFQNFPEKAVAFYEKGHEEDARSTSLLEEERKVFGFDHVAAGRHLMQELNFLKTMELAVSLHHEYNGTGEYSASVKMGEMGLDSCERLVAQF